jgi:hypothetical protein
MVGHLSALARFINQKGRQQVGEEQAYPLEKKIQRKSKIFGLNFEEFLHFSKLDEANAFCSIELPLMIYING